MTTQEIELTTVIRANFNETQWRILVKDNDGFVYSVTFEGSESDTNEELLINTNNELLNIEKQVINELPVIISRDNLTGLSPITE